jgi:dipeptidyl aminopeptidase/acylaminoacyl peptidase
LAETDAALLAYDKYDIWQVDPSGKKTPINLTNGYGRKNNIEFRLANERDYAVLGNSIGKYEKILLYAFNLTNKSEGFYRLSLGEINHLDRLTMGPYDYNPAFGDRSPIKARDAEIYLIKRSRTTESPNYFWTDDFKTFTPVSEVFPEKKYNWLTSELISFKTLDSHITQGVIYKPEDFDPEKKYPVIIHYYEQKSDNLNKYQRLFGNDGMDISIAWFVSHGYLVFTPDIHYKLGKNGQSGLNAVLGAADYLSGMPWVDAKHIGLQGESFGGFETNYIVTHTTRFAAAISSSGSSNAVSEYGSLWGAGNSKQGYYENRQGRMGATLWENPAAYIENSPIFQVDKITTPMLTVANKKDGNVSFGQGLELFLALRRLGKKGWMLQYDGQTHGLDGNAFIDFTIRSQQFFDHYLKGTPPPKWMTEGVPAKLKGIDSGLEFDMSGKQP